MILSKMGCLLFRQASVLEVDAVSVCTTTMVVCIMMWLLRNCNIFEFNAISKNLSKRFVFAVMELVDS
jgi:hypothetical protein